MTYMFNSEFLKIILIIVMYNVHNLFIYIIYIILCVMILSSQGEIVVQFLLPYSAYPNAILPWSRNYERFISFSHLYFLPIILNTYQFDFKLHYQAYIIFMSFPLVYLFIFFYFLNSHCIPICFNFSSWAAICFNKLVYMPYYHGT